MKANLIALALSVLFVHCAHSEKKFCVDDVKTRKALADEQLKDVQNPNTLRALQETSAVDQQARVVPAREEKSGAIYGYKFVEIQPDSIFDKMGFRKEDVIIGVNNKTITQPRDAKELYQALQSGEPLSIHMVRDGKEVVLPFR